MHERRFSSSYLIFFWLGFTGNVREMTHYCRRRVMMSSALGAVDSMILATA
jgi:transcriptional regulator with GAF, ATPase, and Fis domain